jgi:diguanylate cyclase (GGDEF)-like protein
MARAVDFWSSGCRERMLQLEAELASARNEIKELQGKLETDPLLKIPNRNGFDRELKRALAYTSRYQTSTAVLLVELRHSTWENRRIGERVSDAVLEKMTAALVRRHRSSDVVARFDDSRLALILWHIREADVRNKLRWVESFVSNLQVDFRDVSPLDVAIGITMLKRFDAFHRVIERLERDLCCPASQVPWPAPGSQDTKLGVLMEPEVGHGETEVHARVQA